MKAPYYEASGCHRTLTYKMETAEESRLYIFPGGDQIRLDNIVEGRVSRHGNHQLTTADGSIHVIPWGWICLTFPQAAKVTPEEVKTKGN